MKKLTLAVVVMSFIAVSAMAQIPAKTPAESKMLEFHMALLKRGPKWSDNGMTREVQLARIANMKAMLGSGKAVIVGSLGDPKDILEVMVLRTKTAAEAKTLAEKDPAVQSGDLVAEMHPWWSEDVMKKATAPLKMETAYLGLLTRGPKWTPEKTAATEELQKAHIANIIRLAQMKKLVVAGPFGDDGTLRGIFVFRTATLAEAQQLAATDPAVQAGRLAIEIRHWFVPEGILP